MVAKGERRAWYYVVGAVLALSWMGTGCRALYPEVLFIDDVDAYRVDTLVPTDYRLAPGDQLEVLLSPAGGTNLLEEMNVRQILRYEIMPNGYVYLPGIDSVRLAGLTIEEARDTLTMRYRRLYKDPYVYLRVTNRFAYVFYGNDARVVPLKKAHVPLIEVLAAAGGIPEMHKAYRVRVLRLLNGRPVVKEFNLRTVRSLPEAYTVIQANDVIYVEPTRRIAPALLREMTPLLTLLSSTTSLILTILLFQQVTSN